MRKVTLAAIALASSAALVGVTAVPALAADTPTTVTVDAGQLSITVPAAADLSTVLPGEDSTATLGATKVTDARAGTAGWEATVSLPALIGNTLATETIPTTGATYLAEVATPTGTVSVAAPTAKTDLTTATAKISQTATGVNGNNSASWGATLTVPIPTDVLADSYSGTMTQSVS